MRSWITLPVEKENSYQGYVFILGLSQVEWVHSKPFAFRCLEVLKGWNHSKDSVLVFTASTWDIQQWLNHTHRHRRRCLCLRECAEPPFLPIWLFSSRASCTKTGVAKVKGWLISTGQVICFTEVTFDRCSPVEIDIKHKYLQT